MNEIRVEEILGEQIKPAIDEFYQKNGSQGTARRDDLFFVAYSGDQIAGCVRFCVEEGTPLLRTMHVDSSCRKQGVGRLLLRAFGRYLDRNKIENVFCLPYAHLEKFYGIIHFKTVEANEVPRFLVERSAAYAKNGTHTLYMRRS